MTKDVIYIDVEDDITTIVGKIKASKEKIIALVPPNRVGVLQSAVNMRLLQRAAEQAKKRVVLISNNPSLASLAAAAQIPVARNLQSKPELAEVPVFKVDDDEVIDGQSLPVGEIARTAATDKQAEIAINAAIQSNTGKAATGAATTPRVKKTKQKSTASKVPNFSTFRKRLFIGAGALVLFIGFLVWAIWFAPRATVVITAKTTPATVNSNVGITLDGETNVEQNTLKAIRQEQKADVSVEFTATGEKNVGEKATGRVRFTTRDSSSQTIPAGAILTAGGFSFKLENAVTVPAATLSFECGGICPGTATGTIIAAESGERYNGVGGSVRGVPPGVSASLQGSTRGGTDRMAKVVSEDDVARARDLLSEKKDDTLREKLEASFGSSSIVIADSYNEERSNPSPSVAVDAEASGPVTLKTTITASMLAVDQVDLEKFLRESIEREIEGQAAQKIYEDGSKDAKFTQFVNRDGAMTVRLSANGLIGPEVEEAQVKDLARGKTYGDIQSSLEAIQGVDDVDTRFWPFWVRTVPDNPDRITVEFKLEDVQ